MKQKLFAVCLGGRADKCHTELHDVVFVVGPTIQSTYEQLMDRWFGTPHGLHLDSWVELDIVDGYKINLAETTQEGRLKLYFINLGAYKDGAFGETHATKFLIAESLPEAKARGKRALLQNWPSPVHTDDLYEVDDCLELTRLGTFHIVLSPTDQRENLKPVNGYHLIPKSIVQDYIDHKAAQGGDGDMSLSQAYGDR